MESTRSSARFSGRRIKRSIYIDLKSICFIENEKLDQFKKIDPLEKFINMKDNEAKDSSMESGKRMTNIGLFRKYMEFYLQNHAKIRKDMTLVVRHRQPTENGLPVEIYAFTSETGLRAYEEIQSEVFDHILSILPEFGLRVFQNPTGEDFRKLIS